MVSYITCRVIECRLQITIGTTDPKSTVWISCDYCQLWFVGVTDSAMNHLTALDSVYMYLLEWSLICSILSHLYPVIYLKCAWTCCSCLCLLDLITRTCVALRSLQEPWCYIGKWGNHFLTIMKQSSPDNHVQHAPPKAALLKILITITNQMAAAV